MKRKIKDQQAKQFASVCHEIDYFANNVEKGTCTYKLFLLYLSAYFLNLC